MSSDPILEAVAQAATLPPVEYDLERKALAKAAGIRVSVFDKAVEAERARLRQAQFAERRARRNGSAPALAFDQKLDRAAFPYLDDKGLPIAHLDNVTALLDGYGFEMFYDANAKRGIWSHPQVANDTDNADSLLESHVLSLANLNEMPTASIGAHLSAHYERNQRAPVAEYLAALKWDGKPRFHLFAEALASDDDPATVAAASRVFLLLACAAADNGSTGIAARAALGKFTVAVFEYILTLHAPQGRGKTKRFLKLFPGALRDYLREGVTLDLRNKDSVLNAVSAWITELGEIDATFKKSDVVALKAFTSLPTDNIRLPYARAASKLRRRVAFFGTVNDPEYLRDATGARRFLAVTTGHIDPQLDDATINQLWAEAWSRYAAGEAWWPTDEEEMLLAGAAEERREKSAYEERLAALCDWSAGYAEYDTRYTASDIYAVLRRDPQLSISTALPCQADLRGINAALRKLWPTVPGVVLRPNGDILVPVGAESVGARRRRAAKEGGGLSRAYSPSGKQVGWLMPPSSTRKERKF